MQQLLQSRYGFYGRPFESDSMFDLDQCGSDWGSRTATKPSSIAASFAALHQLVNGVCSTSSPGQLQPADGQKDRTHAHLESLSLKRSCDLLDVEPLPYGLASASDGVRLERTDSASAVHSQFTAVALNGLVEASKLSSSGPNSGPASRPPTSHRWHHLLGTSPPLVIVMERLHSGGRKFAVLDFGSPVLLVSFAFHSSDVVLGNICIVMSRFSCLSGGFYPSDGRIHSSLSRLDVRRPGCLEQDRSR